MRAALWSLFGYSEIECYSVKELLLKFNQSQIIEKASHSPLSAVKRVVANIEKHPHLDNRAENTIFQLNKDIVLPALKQRITQIENAKHRKHPTI